jgi:HAD superfamily hydrolase (TIGR01509 family)
MRVTMKSRPVRAVLFDLDGTLMDSETQTDQAVTAVAGRHGVADFSLPPDETHGRTWEHVADAVRARARIAVPAATLVAEMLDYWNAATADAKPVPGAPEAVHAAFASGLRLAVVSSSPRSVIDRFLDRLGIGGCIEERARIGADSVRRSKPDPEGFLLAAHALGAAPADSLVFEDSRAGLVAAQRAGMRSMFVSCCAADLAAGHALATAACSDYRALPPRFWEGLVDGSLDLEGRSYP